MNPSHIAAWAATASANSRRRRCLRVSAGPPALLAPRLSGAGSGLDSGSGSVSGSRRKPGCSSIPEEWQTMQQSREPRPMES